MTSREPAGNRSAAPELTGLVGALAPLLTAESDAEAPAAGVDSHDLQQAVWLRLLECHAGPGLPDRPADWLRRAVRAEARRARRTAVRELPYGPEGEPLPDDRHQPGHAPGPECAALAAERQRALRTAVRRSPVACRRLLAVMLSPNDLTYREIAGRLGISQGSLGPMRSRCLGCLRRMLAAEVAAPGEGDRCARPTGRIR
ncbi:sigma-70 family RNA polymerase sigma factor [Streptomyces sp. CC210A]|uniref:sigma-70 family RNA polymerase sigma factor n=1 Tax=Streptomyces sp. CC210A TaxID=2898184 RepID=UPI001F481313|nr:sigma-70 family RNA polymerase sigma factor [Streptomyces sp. CC210A]